jgi:glucose/arabinose dehydrogenase
MNEEDRDMTTCLKFFRTSASDAFRRFRARRAASVAVMIAAAALSFGAANPVRAGSGIVLPDGFHGIDLTDTLNAPVAIAFAPDGRLFVVEKRGVVKVYEKGVKVSTFINLQAEVNGAGDRGMLGIALDPDFDANHYVYLL